MKNSQNVGEYIADHDGYYEDEGFTKVDLIAGPTAVEQSAATGHATVAGSTALGTANAIDSEGMPIKHYRRDLCGECLHHLIDGRP